MTVSSLNIEFKLQRSMIHCAFDVPETVKQFEWLIITNIPRSQIPLLKETWLIGCPNLSTRL
jgi:hypothetical protein